MPLRRIDITAAIAGRFNAKVIQRGPGECWPWAAATNLGGYGIFQINGKPYGAHRVAYIIKNGDIPEPMCVCHTCDNPPCCNPAHLWLGTMTDNRADCVRKGRQAKGDGHWTRLYPDMHPRLAGEQCGAAVWSAAVVRQVRRLAADHISQAEIARRLKIPRSTVGRFVRRENFREV